MNINSDHKLQEIIVLMEVLKILRDEKSRIARKQIYENYLDTTMKNKKTKFPKKIQVHINKIKGDFDEIGFLIEYGYLKEVPFFDLYSDVICRIWKVLENDIQNERLKRQSKKKNLRNSEVFLQFFEKLANRAQKYRVNKGLPEPRIIDLRN